MHLEDALHKVKNDIKFNPEKKARMRADLLRIVEADVALQPGVRVREFERHSMGRSNFIRNIFRKQKTMPIFAVILMLVLAGGGTSLAAQGSLPGSPCYSTTVPASSP